MRTKLSSALMIIVLLTLAGCSVSLKREREAAPLEFQAPMNVNSREQFHASLGVRNVGTEPFRGYEAFNGSMELRDETGEQVSRIQVTTLWYLEPGEAAWPAAFRSKLAPGAYQITWGAPDYSSVVVDFTIVEHDGRLYMGEESIQTTSSDAARDDREYGPVQSLVDLAKVDLMQRLGVDINDVAVQTIEKTEFPDASLGVPEPGKMYAQVITPGYVIRLVVDGEIYEYHASNERLVFASPSSLTPAPVYRKVDIPEAGLMFEVPDGWRRLEPEWTWSPDSANSLRLGVNWMDVQPPQEMEAALLPNHSQTIHSEPVELGWASGRRFTVEVYAPAEQGGDTQAPVQSVETHVIVVVSLGDTRRAFDFYARGQTAEQLAILEPSLQHMLATSILTD